MPINTRESRREADKKYNKYILNYVDRFYCLLHNSVIFENIGELPKRYLMNTLIEYGAIAYDYETKLWLRFNRLGIDIYGLPKKYQLIGYNGYTIMRNTKDVAILRINDLSMPLKPYLFQQAAKIVDYDMAIEQNLEAIKTMTIAETDSQEGVLSLVNLAENRRVGATICYVNKNAMTGTALKVSSTGAQYLVDKLQEARLNIFNETLATLGISSANTAKRERVQGMEVEASLGYAIDNAFIVVDTFNYDAEYANLPIRMKANSSIVDIAQDGELDKGKENGRKQENNSAEN